MDAGRQEDHREHPIITQRRRRPPIQQRRIEDLDIRIDRDAEGTISNFTIVTRNPENRAGERGADVAGNSTVDSVADNSAADPVVGNTNTSTFGPLDSRMIQSFVEREKQRLGLPDDAECTFSLEWHSQPTDTAANPGNGGSSRNQQRRGEDEGSASGATHTNTNAGGRRGRVAPSGAIQRLGDTGRGRQPWSYRGGRNGHRGDDRGGRGHPQGGRPRGGNEPQRGGTWTSRRA